MVIYLHVFQSLRTCSTHWHSPLVTHESFKIIHVQTGEIANNNNHFHNIWTGKYPSTQATVHTSHRPDNCGKGYCCYLQSDQTSHRLWKLGLSTVETSERLAEDIGLVNWPDTPLYQHISDERLQLSSTGDTKSDNDACYPLSVKNDCNICARTIPHWWSWILLSPSTSLKTLARADLLYNE